MKKIEITEALISLAPGAWWTIDGEIVYENIQWLNLDHPMPTEQQVTQETARLQAVEDSKEYQQLRVKEYPSIGDQLDALWKGGEEAEKMLTQVQAVKNKYPKPE